MKLDSFRIRNCFGFVDSGEINLDDPGNFVYFLGRNSSGKTSVLRALSAFQHGQVPSQHPNFENYERSTDLSYLMGRFSVNDSVSENLKAAPIVNNVIERLGTTALQISISEDGFSVGGPLVRSTGPATTLLNSLHETYTALVEPMRTTGLVSVAKLGDGSYQFFTEGYSNEEFQRRRQDITNQISSLKSAFANDGHPFPEGITFRSIEALLLMQFPDIFAYTERFSLDENLPRAITDEHLRRRQNSLTEAFMDLLNKEVLNDFLEVSSRVVDRSLITRRPSLRFFRLALHPRILLQP